MDVLKNGADRVSSGGQALYSEKPTVIDERVVGPLMCADPCLAKLAKADKRPYWPSKYENLIDNNGAFSLLDKTLMCRHMATYYANKTARSKFNFDDLRSQNNVSVLDFADFDEQAFIYNPGVTKDTGDHRDFGEWVRTEFDNLEKTGSGDRIRGSGLVETCNHALGVAFQIKTLEDGSKRYVITVFDPNDSLTHCRMAVSSPRRFADMQLRDFCRPQLFDDYTQGQTSVLYATNIPRAGPKQSVFSRAQAVRRRWGAPTSVEARLFLAMRNDVPKEVSRFDTIAANGRTEMLLGRAPAGCSALYIAMQQNSARSIAAYSRLITKAPVLSDVLWKRILRAASEDGTPGLYIALQEGSADAIDRYGDLLVQSGIRDELFIKNLLLARQQSGTCGLSMALRKGHAQAIDAYRLLLERMNTIAPNAVKAVLRQVLLAKGVDGVPALFVALQDNKAGAIDAYGRLLKFAAGAHPEVVRDLRAEILHARRPNDGLSGLTMAAWRNCGDAIKAFGSIVPMLIDNEQELLTWLLGRRPLTGASALYLAVANNHPASVAAYSALLDVFALSQDSKIALLRADKISGETGVGPGIAKGGKEALTAYAALLRRHGAGLNDSVLDANRNALISAGA